MAKTAKELEHELQQFRTDRLFFADQKLKWQIRESQLLKVIFQLSAALDHAEHH